MTVPDLLGLAAAGMGFAVCVGPVAQTITILRLRSSLGVSLTNFSLVLASSTLWTAYGIAIGNAFVAVPNAIDGVLSAITIAVGLRFRHPRHALPRTIHEVTKGTR